MVLDDTKGYEVKYAPTEFRSKFWINGRLMVFVKYYSHVVTAIQKKISLPGCRIYHLLPFQLKGVDYMGTSLRQIWGQFY